MTVDVTVLGSANLDVVLRVAAIPAPGETVLARGRDSHPGGKGLNQAVAAARAGARTALVAAVGREDAAEVLLGALHEAGVDTRAVSRLAVRSGLATVVVQDSGENAIVVDPGANAELRLGAPAVERLQGCRVLVASLEVPVPVVREAAELARTHGVLVVLNAAPAAPLGDELLGDELLGLVDVLVVNEHEAQALAGTTADPLAAGRALTGASRSVVVTLGARGAVHVAADGTATTTPGMPARAVDTTGAGDAFVGVLAAALADGDPLVQGLRRAVAAGALAVETAGAVPSLPVRAAVDARLAAGGAQPP